MKSIVYLQGINDGIRWGFSIFFLPLSLNWKCEIKVWLISVLMITKQGLELMIIFQVWLSKTISKVTITKTNQAKEKSWRRRPPQREVFFKDPSFIRSLCKVVSALGFSCITFFTYAPKSSKSYFVLKIFKLDDFMFSTKTLCQMFFKLV